MRQPLILTLLLVAGGTAAEATAQATTAAATPDCPTASFPAVAAARENDRWPEPVLEVSCSDTTVTVRSNGIPPYEFERVTPADLRAQEHVWTFPRDPQLADEIVPIPLLGPIAVATNGLPIYGPNEGPHPDPFGDPVYNDILDTCMGHTARRGDYHYHALVVECLLDGQSDDSASPVLAWAFDGFPIYGPIECSDATCSDLLRVRSGWSRSGDPSTDAWYHHEFRGGDIGHTLDACNGHVGPAGAVSVLLDGL